MAYEEVNEENVYLCTGNPLPSDIRNIVNWMLNEDFSSALERPLLSPHDLADDDRNYRIENEHGNRPPRYSP